MEGKEDIFAECRLILVFQISISTKLWNGEISWKVNPEKFRQEKFRYFTNLAKYKILPLCVSKNLFFSNLLFLEMKWCENENSICKIPIWDTVCPLKIHNTFFYMSSWIKLPYSRACNSRTIVYILWSHRKLYPFIPY